MGPDISNPLYKTSKSIQGNIELELIEHITLGEIRSIEHAQ
jgi:hypothetical protein